MGVERKTYISWENGTDVKSSYIPRIAEFYQIEIKDLFRDKPGEIHINQYNSNNNDSSINGIVLLLTDKESVNELVKVLKKKINIT